MADLYLFGWGIGFNEGVTPKAKPNLEVDWINFLLFILIDYRNENTENHFNSIYSILTENFLMDVNLYFPEIHWYKYGTIKSHN